VTTPGGDSEILSREELDALLAEMPALLCERSEGREVTGSRDSDIELERANESFGLEYGRTLSNRHERVIQFAFIGQRPIDLSELAELMLPTDVVGSFQIMPKGIGAALLLSRPFFFEMLCTLFGAGATLKPVRPPIREYTRIERRFYGRIVKEMLVKLEQQWQSLAPVSLVWSGLLGRAAVGEAQSRPAVLATYDVRGFSEPCRVRLAVPTEAFRRPGAAASKVAKPIVSEGVSVLDVPIKLRAQVGTAELSLAEVGRLSVGQSIALDVPSDGTLTVRIGDRDKFRGIAGTRGQKRAVQLQERIEGLE
jgi:flagellar motor switch protein FliM